MSPACLLFDVFLRCSPLELFFRNYRSVLQRAELQMLLDPLEARFATGGAPICSTRWAFGFVKRAYPPPPAPGPFPPKGPEGGPPGAGAPPGSTPSRSPARRPARLRSGRLGQGAKTQSQSRRGEAERSVETQFALAAPNEMDCVSDIVWNFGDEEDGIISDAFCASSSGAGRCVAFLGASLLRSQD
jgi:hypothetical protein